MIMVKKERDDQNGLNQNIDKSFLQVKRKRELKWLLKLEKIQD